MSDYIGVGTRVECVSRKSPLTVGNVFEVAEVFPRNGELSLRGHYGLYPLCHFRPVKGDSDLHVPGAKDDGEKLDPTFLDDFPRALEAICKVAQMGAEKYSRGGWLHVEDGQRRYRAAGARHRMAIAKGEGRDQESRFPHLYHAAWNALAELELYERERENTENGEEAS